MVFWCTYPGSILNRNNLGYSSACPNGTLADPSDIPRLYFARYSYYYLGMARKNVASFFHTAEHPRRSVRTGSRRRRQATEPALIQTTKRLLAEARSPVEPKQAPICPGRRTELDPPCGHVGKGKG